MTETARQAATLDQVARVAGVSRATVSRVVNDTRNVDPELRRVVQDAITATGYVPNRAARSLRTRRLGSVALVVCSADPVGGGPRVPHSLTDPYVARIVGAALVALQERDVRLELLFVEDPDARATLVRRLAHHDVDGVLLVSMHTGDPLPGMIAATGRPAVLIGRPAEPVALSTVDVDQRAGAALAAERLVAAGCRHVATIAGPPQGPGAQERLGGFLDAMAGHGFLDVPVAGGDFSIVAGESAMAWLLDTHPRVDGVFAANDHMGQGALLTLRERRVRVPGRVAVVGFDDSRIASDTRPRLTTVRQPLEDMAAEMVRLLLESVAEPATVPRAVVLHPVLAVRESA